MFRWLLRAAPLFMVCGLATAHAADTDWGSTVFTSVNNLVDQDGALFVHTGIAAVAAAGFSKLLWNLFSVMVSSAFSEHRRLPFDLESIIKIFLQIWALTMVLTYWSTPAPGMSISLHQIPMYLSDSFVAGLATSQANQFMAYVKQVATQMNHPNPLALLDVAVYIFILANMGMLALCTFLLTSFSYIGEAVFVVITPLFFWCTFFQTVFSWCWNCIQNMLSFAAYKLVGAIIIYVLSDMMVSFFVNGVGTDYTIAHWIVLLPVVIMFTGLFVFALFMVPLLCASIFNGAGALGQAVTVAAGRFI